MLRMMRGMAVRRVRRRVPDGVSVLLLRLLPACVRIACACVGGQARAHSREAKFGEAREGGKRVADRDSSARPQLVVSGAHGAGQYHHFHR